MTMNLVRENRTVLIALLEVAAILTFNFTFGNPAIKEWGWFWVIQVPMYIVYFFALNVAIDAIKLRTKARYDMKYAGVEYVPIWGLTNFLPWRRLKA